MRKYFTRILFELRLSGVFFVAKTIRISQILDVLLHCSENLLKNFRKHLLRKNFTNKIVLFFACTIICLCTHTTVSADFLSSVPLIGSIPNIFSTKEEIELEEVMLSLDEKMNKKGAIKLHVVIIFEKELLSELKRMSSREYFRSVEQLVRDNPDKMKVFHWEFKAIKRITEWIKLPYESKFMTVVGGIIFAKYDTIGEHRALVPTACKKLKITLEEDTFKIHQADQPTENSSSSPSNEPFSPKQLKPDMPSEDIIPRQLNNEYINQAA